MGRPACSGRKALPTGRRSCLQGALGEGGGVPVPLAIRGRASWECAVRSVRFRPINRQTERGLNTDTLLPCGWRGPERPMVGASSSSASGGVGVGGCAAPCPRGRSLASSFPAGAQLPRGLAKVTRVARQSGGGRVAPCLDRITDDPWSPHPFEDVVGGSWPAPALIGSPMTRGHLTLSRTLWGARGRPLP